MRKFMAHILAVLCFAAFLTGCTDSQDTADRTLIELKKNGSGKLL